MRSKVTFLLLALNLALFGYLLLSERPWSATQKTDENRRRVLGPEAAQLSAVEITTHPAADALASAPSEALEKEGASTLRLELRGDTWFLASPLDWPANDFAVRRILNELQFLEHETSFPVSDLARNGQTLADYGLEKPRLIVTCTPKASEGPAPALPSEALAKEGAPAPFTLKIGATAAVGGRLYVLSPDARRIHVVGQSLAAALTLDLAQLRSDQLFTIPVFEARALTLQSGAATTARTRLRRDQTRWLFESPITTRAAKTPVELAINDLNTLRVARFIPAPDAPSPDLTGLSAPRLRLTLEGNARRETLVLGLPVAPPAATPGSLAFPAPPSDSTVELYARLDWRTTPSAADRPVLFTVAVPAAVLSTLENAQTALRDKRVLDLDPAQVTSLALSAPLLPELRIQKLDTDAGWQLSAPAPALPRRADPAVVGRLLQRLQLLEAVRFASDAPSKVELENLGFNRPERTVVLQLAPPAPTANSPATGPSTLTLEIAQPVAGGADTFARVAGQPFIYAVPADTLAHLPLAPRYYRDRALARLPDATRITRLVIRRAAPAVASATAPSETLTKESAPLLDFSPAPASPTPSQSLPDNATATLLAFLRDLRAKDIVREDYPATVLVDGVEQPWAYVLEATLDPAPPAGPLVLSLAERTGGMTQLIGSESLGLVFTAEQPVLDALWTLLYAPRDVPAP